MNTRLLTALSFACIAALPLCAQDPNPKQKDRLGLNKVDYGEHNPVNKDFWTCIIGHTKDAMTMVKLANITSISKQTYMLEGSQKILEVTIDTTGNNSIRFYYLNNDRANRAANRAANTRAIVDKYTDNVTQNVMQFPSKKYPEGTYSHNIEFQLDSPEHLHAIYESATHAWVTGKAATLRFKQ